jgi:F0F1-type ATP synthase alpha subunit
MDTIEVNQISEFEDQLMETIKKDYANILDDIRSSNTLSDESEDLLKKALDSFLDNFKKNS